MHVLGCTLLILVSYKVWFSALVDDEASEGDEHSINNRRSVDADRAGVETVKAAYRYERYKNRNKPNVGSPGENGASVVLTGKDKALADSLFKKEAFNIIASNRIALNRTVPDVRDPA